MLPHMVCLGGSIPTTSTNFPIPIPNDTLLTTTLGGLFGGFSLRALLGYVRGVNVTAARLNSPNLRAVGPPQLWPIDTAASPPNLPPLIRYRACGPVIPPFDPFVVEVTTAVAVAADAQAVFLFGDKVPEPDTRPSRTILANATITQVNNVWVAGQMTLPQTLPAGRYAIVGLAVFGAGLLAARLIFPTQMERPGVLAQQLFSEYDDSDYRYGQFGVIGEFTNIQLPALEVFGFAAGAAQTIYLDIVQLSQSF